MPNSPDEYKVVADVVVSSDDSLVLKVVDAVYINSVSPNNRVAKMSDVQNGGGGGTGPQTWESPNENTYTILQAHGGTEVQTTASSSEEVLVDVIGTHTNANNFTVTLANNAAGYELLKSYYDGTVYPRRMALNLMGNYKEIRPTFYNENTPTEGTTTFYIDTLGWNITTEQGNSYSILLEYGGPPVEWWIEDDIEVEGVSHSHFRGAKIDYHAYVMDSGTMIGTIYIARDGNDGHVAHIETASGNNDVHTAILWKTVNGQEDRLWMYRTDGEASTTRIHWTAQLYYSPEYYD